MLIAVASFWIYQTFTDRGVHRSVTGDLRMFSAGVAIMAGGGLVFAEFVNEMSTDSARLLLGYGLMLIGGAGLCAAWFLPEGTPDRLAAIGINGLVIGLGAITLYQLKENQSFFERSMWLMVAIGVGTAGLCNRRIPSFGELRCECSQRAGDVVARFW